MLVAIQTLNNITSHKLLTARCGILSEHYQHQNTNDLEKLLEQEDVENTSKVALPIFLTIGMYIGPTRLFEVGPPKAVYDSERRLHEGCIGVDWGDQGEIAVVMAAGNDKDDNDKDPQEKTR